MESGFGLESRLVLELGFGLDLGLGFGLGLGLGSPAKRVDDPLGEAVGV